MAEHLRALVVILVLSAAVFAVQRWSLPQHWRSDFARRRNAWFAITLIAFLFADFWYYIIAAGVVVLAAAGRERNRSALYFALLFAVPPFSQLIPGLGLVQHIFTINHPRLLVLVVLLPAFFSLISQPARVGFGRLTIDKFIIGYLVVQIGFLVFFNSFTQIQRSLWLLFLDVFLPYYVISRALNDRLAMREALVALVFAILLTTPLAVFEFTRRWLLYSRLDEAMGFTWGFGSYLSRGESIRATVTGGHPIAFGYSIAFALALYAYVSHFIASRPLRVLGWIGLAAALFASVSRGPWVGAAAGLLVVFVLGKGGLGKRILSAMVIGLPLVGLVALTPLGAMILDYLPFVGTADEGSVIYRQRVFEVSMQVILQYPLFGAYSYTGGALEELRQGEGIIDIVNAYVGIALSNGIVGLSVFVGVFAAGAWSVWRGWNALGSVDRELESLGRCLLGALAAVLVTLATTSTVGLIAQIYWLLAGLCAAFEIMCLSFVTERAGHRHQGRVATAGRMPASANAA